MRISLIQVSSPDNETVAARRNRVGDIVTSTMGADLVVLPELWASGYFAFDEYTNRAEPFDGDTVAAGRDWAKSLGCYLHLGSFLERANGGTLYNTAVLIDPTGEIAHIYRKIHVFGFQSREAKLISPGASVKVSQTTLGPIGSAICYDLRFPELWRALLNEGANMVLVPSAWPAARRNHWQLFTTCRAVEEQIVVCGCNAVGTQSGIKLGGFSRVIDPNGKVIVEANDQEGVVSCDIDINTVETARKEFPVLLDRRPQFSTTEHQIEPRPI